MIKDILTLLENNKNTIKFEADGSFDKNKVNISKFSHADQKPYRKVLFLVTYAGVPKLIIKIMRESRYNDRLHSECQRQRRAALSISDFYIPQVLFEDTIAGLFVYGEEAITGAPLQLEDAQRLLSYVYVYQKDVPKMNSVKSDVFIEILDSLHIPEYKEYVMARRELEKCRHIDVPLGLNHGDMTVRNIITYSQEKLALIDWENYTDKVIWGIDAIHFFIRIHGILSPQDFLVYQPEIDVVFTQQNNEYCLFLYLMDWIYDIFQKDLSPEYYQNFLVKTQKLI